MTKPVDKPVDCKTEEFLTVKQYADLNHVTAQAVYKRIKSDLEFNREFVKLIDGKTMIRKTAIADQDKPDPEPQNERQDNMIDLLWEQLKAKDEQIDRLTSALINAQTLQMTAERRYLALLEQKDTEAEKQPLNASESVIKDSNGAAVDKTEDNSQDSQDKPEPEEKPIVKRGIWSKLFSKIKK